jgi:hypothetical protein
MPAFGNTLLDLFQTSDHHTKPERQDDTAFGILQLSMESERLYGQDASPRYFTALQILPFHAGYLPS